MTTYAEGASIASALPTLDDAGVSTTVRTPMGRDIAAACGQLRAQTQPKVRAAATAAGV